MQGHVVAEGFESGDEACGGACGVAARVVVAAEVVVGLAGGEHVPVGDLTRAGFDGDRFTWFQSSWIGRAGEAGESWHRRSREFRSVDFVGRPVAERHVQPVVVEPADVFDDGQLELRACPPDTIGDQLGLEGVDEALGQRVVEGVADRADRGQDAVVVEDLGERLGRVLAARVRVVHRLDVGAGTALCERHSQGVKHEVGAHVRRELPADDLA